MNTAFPRLAIAVCLSLIGLVPVGAQQPPERAPEAFHSSVDLVTIQASVRDSRGRALHGLTPADFEVHDNGQRRPIIELRSDQRSPVSLAILVDMSGSMALPSKIAMARRAFESVLAHLRGGEDEAAVFTFGSSR